MAVWQGWLQLSHCGLKDPSETNTVCICSWTPEDNSTGSTLILSYVIHYEMNTFFFKVIKFRQLLHLICNSAFLAQVRILYIKNESRNENLKRNLATNLFSLSGKQISTLLDNKTRLGVSILLILEKCVFSESNMVIKLRLCCPKQSNN